MEGHHPPPDLSRNAILGCLILENVPAKGIVNAMVFFPPAQDAPPMLFEGSDFAASSTRIYFEAQAFDLLLHVGWPSISLGAKTLELGALVFAAEP